MANLREQVDMAQRRGRSSRVRMHGVGRPADRGSRLDPIFDDMLDDDWADTPGVLPAMLAIEDMRDWGVDVTPEIARKCLAAHLYRQNATVEQRKRQEVRLLAHQHPPIVYYMRLGSMVKIGFTTNLTKRLGVINPEEVMVTEPGGREREQERHRQFAAQKLHGEWFRLEAPLTDHIAAVQREAAGE